MKIALHTDDFRLIKKALERECDGIRFGSEFCEHLLPEQDRLEEAYNMVHGAGKEFTYVTPRLSNAGIEKIREHLAFLNEKENVSLVFNDLGTLNILRHYGKLRPRLGRLLIRMPARSPYAEKLANQGFMMRRSPTSKQDLFPGGPVAKRWYEKLFSHTSLNYSLTVEFFKSYGVRDVDVDWIPRTFARFASLMRQGLNLSVHPYLVPVAFTRKCHTARFLGEKSPEKCSRPCLKEAFMIKNETVGLEFVLQGNAIFTFTQPAPEDLEKLGKMNVAELVVSV